MRRIATVLLGLALAAGGAALAQQGGCNCFPPEVQMKTAEEALQRARLAAFVRVQAVDAAGATTVVVLESFKGTALGERLVVPPPPARNCEAAPPAQGEEALLLAFDEPLNGCELQPAGHYLVASFRTLAQKGPLLK
jgi:hypothetical protein